MRLSITDTWHNNVLNYAECHNAECRVLFIVMLHVIMCECHYDEGHRVLYGF